MISAIPSATRRIAGLPILLRAIAALGILLPCAAQEFRPVVSGRQQERLDSRIQPSRAIPRDGETRQGLELRLAISAAYDDNIFLSADNPQSDLVTTAAVRAAYAHGSPAESGTGYIRTDYQPALVIYAENSDSTRVDHDLGLSAGWRGKTILFAYDGRFRHLGDATADTGVPADRDEYENLIRLAWQLREKLALEFGAGLAGIRYDRGAFFDNRRYFGQTSLNYEYSPKTRLALAYRIGREEVDGSGDQTARQVLARMAWTPREKIAIDLAAGVEYRKFDAGSATNPLLEGRVSWLPREGTEVYLAGFLREEASGFFAGQNYQLGNLTAGLAQSLGGGWRASLEGGWERASYSRVSGTGPAGRVDRILFIGPALEYAPSDALRIGLFYRYSSNDSNQRGLGYDDHQTGVKLEYQF